MTTVEDAAINGHRNSPQASAGTSGDNRPSLGRLLRARSKTAVRRVVRSRGYDIVPLAAGLPAFQRRTLSRSTAVIDVGANVGQFAERVRDLGFDGQIHSFEPGTEAFAVLSDKAAQDSRWSVYRCALGSTAGVAPLHVAANSVSSSLLPVGPLHLAAAPDSATARTESVRVATLDDEIPAGVGECYLKLDVQGFEIEVLRGAERVLSNAVAVQVELSFDALYEGQADWIELCRLLRGHGFHVGYLEAGYEDPRTGQMLQADACLVRDQK